MKIEALLPLGALDPGLRATAVPVDLARVGEGARLAEELPKIRARYPLALTPAARGLRGRPRASRQAAAS